MVCQEPTTQAASAQEAAAVVAAAAARLRSSEAALEDAMVAPDEASMQQRHRQYNIEQNQSPKRPFQQERQQLEENVQDHSPFGASVQLQNAVLQNAVLQSAGQFCTTEISQFHRDLMVGQISAFLRKSKPNAPANIVRQIPALARRIEATLFQSARSVEEYTDKFTLETRMKSIASASAVSLRSKRQRQTPRNSSCDLVKLHNTHLKRAMIQHRDASFGNLGDSTNPRARPSFVACVSINGEREIAFNFSKTEEPHLARPEAPQVSQQRPEMPQEQLHNHHPARTLRPSSLSSASDHHNNDFEEDMHDPSSSSDYSSDEDDDDDDDDDEEEEDDDNSRHLANRVHNSSGLGMEREDRPPTHHYQRHHHSQSTHTMNTDERLARIHTLLATLVRTPRSQQQNIHHIILELQNCVVNGDKDTAVPHRKLTEALGHAMVEMRSRMDSPAGAEEDMTDLEDMLDNDEFSTVNNVNMPSAVWSPEIRESEIREDQAARLHPVSHLLNFAAEHCAYAPVDIDLLGVVLRLLDHIAGEFLLPADKVVLSRSVDRFVEADPEHAAPYVVHRLLKRWPYQNSELQVASLAQLEAVFRASNDDIVFKLLVPVLKRTTRCLLHDNWHVANSAMTFAEKLVNFASPFLNDNYELIMSAVQDLADTARQTSNSHWNGEVRARAASLAFTIYATLGPDQASSLQSLEDPTRTSRPLP